MTTKELNLSYVDAPALESADNGAPITIHGYQLSVGQFLPQGDVALQLLDKVPARAVKAKNPSRQIVEGTTQGSRHIWDSLDGIEVYQYDNTAIFGHIYALSQTRTLTHPEHADQTYVVEDGELLVFRCRYQRAMGEELRRVLD